MKDRPILFNSDMVRALLDGSKTQTRRALRDQVTAPAIMQMAGPGYAEIVNEFGVHIPGWTCPYGQPGDRLWVRETWAPHPDFTPASHYAVYRADPECEHDVDRWRPSIHMPRWASRILLEITNVRVERLQDISEVDALAEGISTVRTKEWDLEHFPGWRREFDAACAHGEKPPIGPLPTESYRMLWESINGTGSWDANPWVWVIEFGRVKP